MVSEIYYFFVTEARGTPNRCPLQISSESPLLGLQEEVLQRSIVALLEKFAG